MVLTELKKNEEESVSMDDLKKRSIVDDFELRSFRISIDSVFFDFCLFFFFDFQISLNSKLGGGGGCLSFSKNLSHPEFFKRST